MALLDFGSWPTLLTQVQRLQITAVAGVSIQSNLPQELVTEFPVVPDLERQAKRVKMSNPLELNFARGHGEPSAQHRKVCFTTKRLSFLIPF